MNESNKNDTFNPTDPRFNSRDAARYLGFAESTLRLSRHTGILAGVEAPLFRKIGRKVIYDRGTLDGWLSQFHDHRSTAM